jgi:hypothetical protein
VTLSHYDLLLTHTHTHRDKDLYISHVRDGSNQDESFHQEEQHAELQAAVMDLTAEDKDGGWGEVLCGE